MTRTRFSFVAGFAAGCIALGGATLVAQDAGDMEAMMAEAMAKYGVPSEQHEELARRVGAWDATLEFWAFPGAPAETMTGNAQFAMQMDGRYLVQHFSSEYMGQTFEGAGLTGYDRMSKEFTSIWIDNMSTAVSVSKGKNPADMRGTMPEPMLGKHVDTRMAETMPDDNTIVFDMFKPGPDGKEFKTMTIRYTRAAG
ncbi:MAG: DUF1579 domain-containing protein [Planctomycetota bacterium]|jgi:hypothetical protein